METQNDKVSLTLLDNFRIT